MYLLRKAFHRVTRHSVKYVYTVSSPAFCFPSALFSLFRSTGQGRAKHSPGRHPSTALPWATRRRPSASSAAVTMPRMTIAGRFLSCTSGTPTFTWTRRTCCRRFAFSPQTLRCGMMSGPVGSSTVTAALRQFLGFASRVASSVEINMGVGWGGQRAASTRARERLTSRPLAQRRLCGLLKTLLILQ